jgi:hypothetical protein
MALSDDAVGGDGSASEVSHSVDDLAIEVKELTVPLSSQDKMLRLAARERKDFKFKYESMLKELKSARASVVVSGETECDEHDELRSRPSLLGLCTVCPGLQTELAKRDASLA